MFHYAKILSFPGKPHEITPGKLSLLIILPSTLFMPNDKLGARLVAYSTRRALGALFGSRINQLKPLTWWEKRCMLL